MKNWKGFQVKPKCSGHLCGSCAFGNYRCKEVRTESKTDALWFHELFEYLCSFEGVPRDEQEHEDVHERHAD